MTLVDLDPADDVRLFPVVSANPPLSTRVGPLARLDSGHTTHLAVDFELLYAGHVIKLDAPSRARFHLT